MRNYTSEKLILTQCLLLYFISNTKENFRVTGIKVILPCNDVRSNN